MVSDVSEHPLEIDVDLDKQEFFLDQPLQPDRDPALGVTPQGNKGPDGSWESMDLANKTFTVAVVVISLILILGSM